MDITRHDSGGIVELAIQGRLDGYWADHVDSVLADVVREGHHRIRLDLAKVTFLSSAGIAVMLKYYKQLARINGLLAAVNPSPNVLTVLRVTRLEPLLLEPGGQAAPVGTPEARAGRRVERDDIRFEVFDLADDATLTCRTIGRGERLASHGHIEDGCTSLGGLSPALIIGVGAFGESSEDCQPRCGEMISVAGATAYQPADGTNVADYLLSHGPLSPDVHTLYGLACEGRFSTLIRFEAIQPGGIVGVASLLAGCLDVAGGQAIGVVMAAEASSLVGAALRRSPTYVAGDGPDFFAHPGVRARLTFTAERAFPRSLVLAAGIVARAGAAGSAGHVDAAVAEQLRPIDAGGCVGHLHAAAFPFRPLERGTIDLRRTVSGLFETGQLLGVLHLLQDDRGAAGAGESEFIRGACWVGPLAGPGKAR